jgi:hypothetical protein
MRDQNRNDLSEFFSWAYAHRLKLGFGVLFFVFGLRIGFYFFADSSYGSIHDLLWGSSTKNLPRLLADFF